MSLQGPFKVTLGLVFVLVGALAWIGCGEPEAGPRAGDPGANPAKGPAPEASPKALVPRKPAPVIEPFGSLRWTDTLTEALGKVNRIPGVEKVEIFLGDTDYRVDMVGVRDKFLGDEIGTLFEQATSRTRRKRPEGKTFKDGKGHSCIHPSWNLRLVASPLSIQATPFRLYVDFAYAPGIALTKGDEMIRVKKGGYTLPMVVSKVVLSSDDSVLKRQYGAISRVLAKKYGNCTRYQERWGDDLAGTMEATDEKGNVIRVRSGPTGYTVTYWGTSHLKALKKAYQEHLDALGGKKLAPGDDDVSDGL